jgi:maltose O-acetyltransferase
MQAEALLGRTRTRARRAVARAKSKVRNIPDIDALRAQGMVIGERCFLGRGVLFDPICCWLITVGDRCTFAPGAMIFCHDASMKRSTGYTEVRRTTIGDRVYVGARAIVLPGVTVGSDVVIAAGAVVSRDVEAGTVVAGVPARPIGSAAEHAGRHGAAIEHNPVFDGPEWRMATGLTPEQRQYMRDALRGTSGYVR